MTELIINKYASDFHDGYLFVTKQIGDSLEVAMESSQLSPLEMKDDIPLSNFSTLKGKLHFKKMNSIKRYGESIQQMPMEGCAYGEILDFEIEESRVLLNIDWCSYRPNGKELGMAFYEIEAEQIFWENIPDLRLPGDFNIEDYERYFPNGRIIRTNFDSKWEAIEIFVESTSIPLDEKIDGTELSKNHTLKGKFRLKYVESVTRNGRGVQNLGSSNDEGKIVSLEVGYHVVNLKVIWFTSPQEEEVIEIKAGSIEWRSDVE